MYFDTPKELIAKLAKFIEKEWTAQALMQEELAQKASIPLPTYKSFLYHHKISLENLLKLLFALKMHDNIAGLLYEKRYERLDDIKNKDKHPKRVRKRTRVTKEQSWKAWY